MFATTSSLIRPQDELSLKTWRHKSGVTDRVKSENRGPNLSTSHKTEILKWFYKRSSLASSGEGTDRDPLWGRGPGCATKLNTKILKWYYRYCTLEHPYEVETEMLDQGRWPSLPMTMGHTKRRGGVNPTSESSYESMFIQYIET